MAATLISTLADITRHSEVAVARHGNGHPPHEEHLFINHRDREAIDRIKALFGSTASAVIPVFVKDDGETPRARLSELKIDSTHPEAIAAQLIVSELLPGTKPNAVGNYQVYGVSQTAEIIGAAPRAGQAQGAA